jgi:hypothetical protein
MNPLACKVMADAYGALGLYKRATPHSLGSMEGWELIAVEADFPALRAALVQAEFDEAELQEIFPT